MLAEKVNVNFDRKLMQLLEEGRKRAIGLLPFDREKRPDDEVKPEAEKKEPKPN